MSERNAISIENRVVVFMDMHNHSLIVTAQEDAGAGFLQEVYERLGEIITDHKGEIIKYIGDAILALFPSGSETAAIECASRMRKALSEIVERRALPAETELEVGISSGSLRIGVFGHRSLRLKDAVGEAVMQAAVIGHHRGIAVTETVYHQIKERHRTNRLADVVLKWQDEPLRVWEVLGPD